MRAPLISLVGLISFAAAIHCSSNGGGESGQDSGAGNPLDGGPRTDASGGSGSGSSDGGSSGRGSGDAATSDGPDDATGSNKDGRSSGSGSGAFDAAGMDAHGSGGDGSSGDGSASHGDGGLDGSRSESGAFDARSGDAHGASQDGSPGSDAPTTTDGGWAFGCSATFQTGPTVPASGYLFFAQGTKSYALDSDNVSWTVVDRNASTATTEPIPLPSGFSAMQVQEEARAYDGSELLLFGAASTPFATFWDGASFSTPVALPADAVTVRADGSRHLFAVDSANVLWDGRSGTFVNRGGIPFQNGVGDIGPQSYGNWDWAVSPSGVVTVVYATQIPEGVASQRYDATLSWSSLVTVFTTYSDSYGEIHVSGGIDESVHTIFVDTSEGTVAGYARTHGTDAWDVHSLPYLANGLDIEASTYADFQALFIAQVSDMNGDFYPTFEWAVPECNGTSIDWWSTITIQSDVYVQVGAPRMGVGAGGYPSFYLASDPGTAIVTTY
jgi:hypothetical protein